MSRAVQAVPRVAVSLAPSPAGSPFTPARRAVCSHCGLPAGEPAGAAATYCCSGCALAHRLGGGGEGGAEAAGLLVAVGAGAFLAMNVMMLSFVLYSGRGEADRPEGEAWVRWALLLLATPALVLLGAPFLSRGLARLRDRRLDTDALIVLGVAAAFTISVRSVLGGGGPLYLDTAMGILLFVTIGRYLEAVARARTTDALATLVTQIPAEATRLGPGDERLEREERVPIEALRPGDLVRVRPGERLPVDGVIERGRASISEAELTGESVPAERGPRDRVAAGTLDLDGDLVVLATRTGADTTLARLVRLVEAAREGRSSLTPLTDRVSLVFVPFVLLLAVTTFAVWGFLEGAGAGVLHALSVLLIACPCALGIAVPLAFTTAIGRAAAAGVLVRSGESFEALARARRVFFDKTGTLTTGAPHVAGLETGPGETETSVLALAAGLESGSEHPVGRAIVAAAAERGVTPAIVVEARARPGLGIEGRLRDGTAVQAGTLAWIGGGPTGFGCPAVPQTRPHGREGETIVWVVRGGTIVGTVRLRDALRPSAEPALAALALDGLALEVLTGDRAEAAAPVVAALERSGLSITSAASLLPEEKAARVRVSGERGDLPLMVGDGINDALALTGAAASVTLESGTDLAREVADVTILGGDLRKLPWIRALARQAMATARRNLFWAFAYNVLGIGLAVSGILHPLVGAVAMIGSSLLVVLHSHRLSLVPLPELPPFRPRGRP